jgi:hypothetical protein
MTIDNPDIEKNKPSKSPTQAPAIANLNALSDNPATPPNIITRAKTESIVAVTPISAGVTNGLLGGVERKIRMLSKDTKPEINIVSPPSRATAIFLTSSSPRQEIRVA